MGDVPLVGLSGGKGVVISLHPCSSVTIIGDPPAGVHSSPGHTLTVLPGLYGVS